MEISPDLARDCTEISLNAKSVKEEQGALIP